MKMNIKNLVIPNLSEDIRPMARTRAASLRAFSGLPSKPAFPDKKPALVMKMNKENSIPSETGCSQRKRKAVLQDVTNVCYEHSYANRKNTTRPQSRNVKQAKKVQTKVSKVIQVVPRKKLARDTKKVDLEPEEPNRSKSLQGNIKSQFKKDNDVFYGKMLISRNPNVKDIDSDHTDPQLCSLYAPEIYNNLRVAELNRRPCSKLMEKIQREVTQGMRAILVDWLVEVCEEYKLASDTLYLTVYLIDWFLSQNYIDRQRLQLLGITCMLIASKYEEICAPRVEEFCFIADNTYTGEEVLKMESQVLNYIGFQMFSPTAKTFLRRFIRAAQASDKTPSPVLEYLANYLTELTLTDKCFINLLPSLIAASAVFLARWTLDQLDHPWNPTLEYYTSYKVSDLKTTVFALQGLQLNTSGCPLTASRTKYKDKKFKSVAGLTSPKLLHTLF